MENQQENTSEDNFSYWKSFSLKIKIALISFLLAKSTFIPAALMVFVPFQSGHIPILRNMLLFLYGFLIVTTIILCFWEMFASKQEHIPPEHKVLEWMEHYSKS